MKSLKLCFFSKNWKNHDFCEISWILEKLIKFQKNWKNHDFCEISWILQKLIKLKNSDFFIKIDKIHENSWKLIKIDKIGLFDYMSDYKANLIIFKKTPLYLHYDFLIK